MLSITKLTQALKDGGHEGRWAFLAHYLNYASNRATMKEADDLYNHLLEIWQQQDESKLPRTWTKEDRDLTLLVLKEVQKSILWHWH